jgi:transposase
MKFEREARVYVAVGVTDLRKAINGLSVLAKEQLGQDPFGGSYFAFSNRGRNRIKVLYMVILAERVPDRRRTRRSA